MFVVMDNDTMIELVKVFAVSLGQAIHDVHTTLIVFTVAFIILLVLLPDLIFLGMKKFDRWKKEQRE